MLTSCDDSPVFTGEGSPLVCTRVEPPTFHKLARQLPPVKESAIPDGTRTHSVEDPQR